MATKRRRSSGSWEFIIKRRGLLPRPLYLSFDSEEEGDKYCARVEAMLDKGVVPPDLLNENAIETVTEAIVEYRKQVAVGASDNPLLDTMEKDYVAVRLSQIDYKWVEAEVSKMKRGDKPKAPGTIRHYMGALARCFDWCERRNTPGMLSNPIRKLPIGYATYTPEDIRIAGVERVDEERDRRLAPSEEKAVREVLKARDPILLLFFDLALETGMRMREMYTLFGSQVDIKRRTIFLDKTKNGDNRQVPLSTVIVKLLKKVKLAPEKLVFPWWDGKNTDSSLKDTTRVVSRLYADIFEDARCPDFNFHDTRHEATSRFYERTTLSDLQISKITGHKDLRMLRRYANLRASNLAEALW